MGRNIAVTVIGLAGIVAVAGCTTNGTAVVAPTAAPTTAAPSSTAGDPTTTPAPAPAPAATDAPTASVDAAGAYEPARIDGLPIAGEGTWRAADTPGTAPVLWTSTFHPLATDPEVKVTAAVFDQRRLTAALFNGTTTPGGGPWQNAARVSGPAKSALVAAFNGGFLFKHIEGGYFTEGKVEKPLVNGQATLGVRKDGRLVLGVYGKDMTNDGSWLSLRQNLPPLVQNGRNGVSEHPNTYWGNDFNHVDLNYRTAVCNRSDGTMMFVAMGFVRATTLADELDRLGCTLAMELDINLHWPQFTWWAPKSGGKNGTLLDPIKMWKPERYVTSSEKDFIALFDPATLPPGSLFGT